jgi:hypothetical protein
VCLLEPRDRFVYQIFHGELRYRFGNAAKLECPLANMRRCFMRRRAFGSS